jgi:hypothetical protein
MSTQPLDTKTTIKVIGNNGQISLGKKFAGRHVFIEESQPGVWLVKLIPENELWIHQPKASQDLQLAINWSRCFSGKLPKFK